MASALTQGGLAYVITAVEAPWVTDPATIEAGVQGIVLASDGAEPQPFLSTLGGRESRWDEAGFLAGVLAGWAGDGSRAVGLVEAEGVAQPQADLAVGFDQGVRYACPGCRVVRQAASGFDTTAFVVEGAQAVFVSSGPEAVPAAERVAESGLWVVWLGELPAGFPIERVAGRIRFAPEALVGQALQALADGRSGESWPFSVGSGSLVFADLQPDIISPGRQRLVQLAWDKLARGELELKVIEERGPGD